MKIHRFLIKENLENMSEVSIADSEFLHQIKNVLRLKKNDEVIFLDGKGKAYNAKVKEILKKSSNFYEIVMHTVDKPSSVEHSVKLLPALIKKDKYETVIQKCTELGISEIHPIITNRTEKLNLNFERIEKIAKESFEQSERIFMPKIFPITNLEEKLIDLSKVDACIFYLDIIAEKINLKEIKKQKEIYVFVGPEGGWDDQDKKLFKKFNIKSFSIGETVLRAETASIAVSSLLMLG